MVYEAHNQKLAPTIRQGYRSAFSVTMNIRKREWLTVQRHQFWQGSLRRESE